MTIREFAETNRFKVKRDECGDLVLRGRRGHIYEHDEKGQLGLHLEFDTARKWNFARGVLVNAGMSVRQDAASEGTLLFDSGNSGHVTLICRFSGIKKRRVMSEAQGAALERARHSSPLAIGLDLRAPGARQRPNGDD